MFTGLIQEVGKVAAIEHRGATRRIVIAAPRISRSLRLGDSVSVSGVCLTAVQIHRGKSFASDLAAETLRRTSLARIAPGTPVNLELPLRSGEPLGGHSVQGHVDGIGRLISLAPVGKDAAGKRIKHRALRSGGNSPSDWWLQVRIPKALARYVVEKGSIAIEGISLTVARVKDAEIGVAIIPHTYAATNLNALSEGDPLNIEVDVLAKYAEKMNRAEPSSAITLERLLREGF